MVTMTQVKNGLVKYIDSDIMPHLSGVKRIGLGVYTALAAESLEATVEKYRKNPAIEMLNVFDESGNVDIDRLYRAAAPHFADGAKYSMDVPLLGVLTLDRNDLERLYRFITN